MTADTYSNTLGYLVMGTGNDNNAWGGNANVSVFQIFEDAIANALTSSVTGGTLDLSGSPPPAAASQVRYAALIFTGVLGSAQIVKVPNLTKFWMVKNATTGAFNLTIQTPSGSASVAIPQNSGWQLVYCDGANAIVVMPFNSAQVQMPDGSAAAPAYSNINETNSGWRRAGAQDWRFVINGVDVLQVSGPSATIGGIATLGAITGGSLYTSGTYTGVSLTGGTGSLATADITVSGGAVTAVTLKSRGQLFTVGDVLSAAAANIGGTGSGFSIPVSAIIASAINALNPNIITQQGSAPAFVSGSPTVGHLAAITAIGIGDGGKAGALANDDTVTQSLLAPDAAPLPYVAAQTSDNLHLLNDGSNPTRDIDVTAGRVRDDSDATNMRLIATMFKRLDTSWAAGGASGSPAGACDSGVKGNNQTWHIFAIGKLAKVPSTYARSVTTVTLDFGAAHGLGVGGTIRPIGIGTGFDGNFPITAVTTNTLTYTSTVSGTVTTTAVPAGTTVDAFDVLASQSYSAPALPSGWTVKQCLGSINTDGSAGIRAFTQVGDEFRWTTPLVDFSSNSFTGPFNEPMNAAGPYSLPLGVSVLARVNARCGTSGTQIYLFNPGDTASSASAAAAPLATLGSNSGATQAQAQVFCDTSAQIGIAPNTAPVGVSISVVGYRDPRRRLF